MTVDKTQPPLDGIAAKDSVASSDHHFRTDHLLVNLKARTISSGMITGIAQGAKFILTLASTVIMARLLTPDDFGLFAMVMAVTSVLRIFKDAGLSAATVQREGISHAQVSNLFWINLALSAGLGLILAAASPLIAGFYKEPRLIAMTLALAASFLFSGSTVQHSALLNRQMRFKALAVIEVSSMLIMLLTGVVMALLGCKYWSLVGSNLAGDASTLVMTWMASGWRPQLPRRGSGTRPLLRFGVNLTAGNIIYTVVRGTDALLIGRWYGANSLGLYNRASGLLMRPLEQFLAPINAVFIPALSRLQNQAERYRAMFLRLYEVVGLVGFTFSGFFLALSHPLTVVLLGAKWEKSADIFAGFTLAAIYFPMGAAASWLFVSQGRGREMLVTTSINSFFTGASFVAGLPFGPFGVAMGFSLSGLVRIPILYYMVGKRGPVAARDLWRVFIGNIPLWVVAFGITCLARLAVENSRALVQLLVAGPIGMLAVAAFILAIPAHRDKVFHFVRAIRTRKAE